MLARDYGFISHCEVMESHVMHSYFFSSTKLKLSANDLLIPTILLYIIQGFSDSDSDSIPRIEAYIQN